jgi:hypothetical protein
MRRCYGVVIDSIDMIRIPDLCIVDGSFRPDALVVYGRGDGGVIKWHIQKHNIKWHVLDRWLRGIVRLLIGVVVICVYVWGAPFIGIALAAVACALAIIVLFMILYFIEMAYWAPYVEIEKCALGWRVSFSNVCLAVTFKNINKSIVVSVD